MAETPPSIKKSAPTTYAESCDASTLSKLCSVTSLQEVAVTCICEDAVQVRELPVDRGEHRVEVGRIADVRANSETSGPKRFFSPRSVLSFKPEIAKRAPFLSNPCDAASPIPLLPPVIRKFLFANLPIIVTPSD